ncbi:MAG: hypothetical protein QM754_12410 [Tepidisphaeraceae bacterium]
MTGSDGIDFTALLREAVNTVNAAHQKAVHDLLDLAGQLDSAVSTLSNGQLHIKLVEVADSPTEVAYEMQLHDAACPHFSFHMYKVPIAGYPIAFGPRGAGSKFGQFESQCLHRTALEQHFGELLTDPKSPLVIQVSFALRHAHRVASALVTNQHVSKAA